MSDKDADRNNLRIEVIIEKDDDDYDGDRHQDDP